ncbi:hypothetical protein HanPSC8_Chr08g0310611 [Helianthus annuus]|nr:hypothetical protein HanPSC8_Chr08g0310611 [Helianthus annuus]
MNRRFYWAKVHEFRNQMMVFRYLGSNNLVSNRNLVPLIKQVGNARLKA